MMECCQVKLNTFKALVMSLKAGQVKGRYDARVFLFQNRGGLGISSKEDAIKDDHRDR
jgi:hypothetical protein